MDMPHRRAGARRRDPAGAGPLGVRIRARPLRRRSRAGNQCPDGFDPRAPADHRPGPQRRRCERRRACRCHPAHRVARHPGGPCPRDERRRPCRRDVCPRLQRGIPGFARTEHRLGYRPERPDRPEIHPVRTQPLPGNLRPVRPVLLQQAGLPGHALP